MNQRKMDDLLKHKAVHENKEISPFVKERVSQTLEELPGKRRKPYLLSITSFRYVAAGIACLIFSVILVSYFNHVNPDTSPLFPSNSTSNLTTYAFEPAPIEPKELKELIINHFEGEIPAENISDAEFLTSIKQKDRWIVLSQFVISDFAKNFALVEMKKENDSYSKRVLGVSSASYNTDYIHWYNVDEGIGYGTASSLTYDQRVEIQTKNGKIISYLHDSYYIYISVEKPEKVTYLTEDDYVMRTLETFNFDEVFPLISKQKGYYTLYVVDPTHSFNSNKYKKGFSIIYVSESMEPNYEFLDLEQFPAYVVFDDKKMIYKTYDEEDLRRFVEQLD